MFQENQPESDIPGEMSLLIKFESKSARVKGELACRFEPLLPVYRFCFRRNTAMGGGGGSAVSCRLGICKKAAV